MTDAITRLRHERAAILARLSKIEDAISKYDEWAGSVVGLLSDETEPGNTTSKVSNENQLKPSPMKEFEQAVRKILTESNGPVSRAELLGMLKRSGIVIGGKEPINTMTTRLTRMEDVANARGQGYWMTEKLIVDDVKQSVPSSTAVRQRTVPHTLMPGPVMPGVLPSPRNHND
ncbi:MAG: hypothetical protein AAFQ64_14285 [Pseudomonadota bacterium]